MEQLKHKKSQASLIPVFFLVLISITCIFAISVLASDELTITTNKDAYEIGEPVTITVEGTPKTNFHIEVVDDRLNKIFPIGNPVWSLNSRGYHHFYLEGIEYPGVFNVRATTENSESNHSFSVGEYLNYDEETINESTKTNESNKKTEKHPSELDNKTIIAENVKSHEEKAKNTPETNGTNNYTNETTGNRKEPVGITEEDEIKIQAPAKVNSPVRWIKRIKANSSYNSFKALIPATASSVKVKKIKNGKETDIEIKNDSISQVAPNQREIEFESDGDEVNVIYYTPGPSLSEKRIGKFRKRLTISSDIHYENITATTEIDNYPRNIIKLYHIVSGKKIPVEISNYIDRDNNGLIDKIEWIVPHTSTQEYELKIDVINVQSYPTVGGNWSVRFNTYGTADLWIRTRKDTTWSKDNENEDLRFLQLFCGEEKVGYDWMNGSVFVSNYSCAETGKETSKVLTYGKHYLEFDFGGQVAYASNDADMFETGYVSTSGRTTVNTKRTYSVPIVVAYPREGGDIDMDHEVAVAIIENITHASFEVILMNETGDTISGNVSYIVAENGSHYLSNGMLLQAGKVDPVSYYDGSGEATNHWYAVTFYDAYSATPAVIASPNNNSADDWIAVRYDSGTLSTTGITLALERDGTVAADTAAVPVNSLSWISLNATSATDMEGGGPVSVSQDPGSADWYSVSFTNTYTMPLFFALGEEAGGTDPATIGRRNLGSSGVDIMHTEERESDTEQNHATENVLWMAFESDLGNTPPTDPTSLTCDGSTDCNISVKDTVVALNASGSVDADGDNITYFVEASLNNQITTQDLEPASVQIKGKKDSIGETGEVNISSCSWNLINFKNEYEYPPIVIATPVTQNQDVSNDDNYPIPRISSVTTTQLNISLCHDGGSATCACYPTPETVDYFVFDRNKTTGISWISMGIESNVLTNGADTGINFGKTFANVPAVFTTPQTSEQGNNIAEIAWVDDMTTTGANLIGCTHQGTGDSCDSSTPSANIGWVAIDLASQNLTNFSYGSATISNSQWTTFSHGMTSPRVMVTQNDDNGGQDPQYAWARDLLGTPQFRYCEADGADYCDTHTGELVYWFAFEDGDIRYDGLSGGDVEAEKAWQTYSDVSSDEWKSIDSINVTINVSGYNNSGSQANGNANPDIQLEIFNGSSWLHSGNFSVSGTGNFTLSENDSSILRVWTKISNRDIRIRGYNFDFNDSGSRDQINYSSVWVKISGQEWTEIGNHTNTTVLNWNVTPYEEQTCVSFRTRAIDLSGSNSYSDYYEKGNCLNITHIDTTPPVWSANSSSVPSGSEYNPAATYYFNVTWEDNKTSVDTVIIEHNFTGAPTPHNDTITQNNSGVYYFNVSGLGAGTYVWREYANNTDGYMNVTNGGNYWTYTVAKNSTNPVELVFINSTGTYIDQNMTIYYEEQVNVTARTVYPSSGTVSLYRDSVDVTPENGNYVTLGANPAGYRYKVNVTGNANYTTNSTGAEFYLFVNKKQTNTHLLINGTRADTGFTQNDDGNFTAQLFGYPGRNVEIWTNYSDGILKLWDSGASPLTNITRMDTLGNFYFLANYSGNANYTYSEEQWNVIVSSLNLQGQIIYFSPTTIDQEENSTITGNCSCYGGTCNNVYMSVLSGLSPISTSAGGDLQVNASNPIFIGTLTNSFSTQTWNITGYEAGNYSISIKCNSTDTGNTFSSAQTLTTNDITYPQWGQNKTSIASGSSYSYGQAYQFNITWTDNVGIDTVLIEHNLTGSSVPHNETVTANASGEFYFDVPSLSTGTYVYRWYANDTSGNLNSSFPLTSYSVSKASPQLSIAGGGTWTYPTQSSVTATEANGGDTDLTYGLFRNETLIDNTDPWSETATLAAGTYIYRFNTSGGQNYSANSTGATAIVNILQNQTNPVEIYINNGTVHRNANVTIMYGTQVTVNVTALYKNSGTPALYRDGIPVSNPDTATLAGGVYEYRGNITGNTNYTSNSTGLSFYVTVLKAPTNTTLFLNGTGGPRNYNKSDTINITVYSNMTGYTVSIYANFSGVFEYINSSTTSVSNFTDTSGLSLGNYLVKANTTGNENYSSSQVNYTLTLYDLISPSYDSHSVNDTRAGNDAEFSLHWTDNDNLSGYVFSMCNGNWNGTDCVDVIGETGAVSLSNCGSAMIEFNNSYQSTPVVLSTPVTQNQGANDDDNPVIPIINMVNSTSMNISICHDNGTASCACYPTPETLHYYVFDRDKIDKLDWIAAGIETNVPTDGTTYRPITYGKTFQNAPAVFISPQTYNQGGDVGAIGWFNSYPTTTGAQIIGCTHRAPDGGVSQDSCDDGGASETYGWVAIDLANAPINGLEYGSDAIGASTWTSFSFSKTNPRVIVTQNSEDGGQDPKYMWARNLDTSPQYRYCEADGRDYCDSHNPETLYWMALEDGPIMYTNAFVNDTWVAFPSGGTSDWSNVTKTLNSTVDAGVSWRIYANDSSDNWQMSDLYEFNTSDPVDPIASLGTNPVDYYNTSSASVSFELSCEDNGQLGTLQLWSDWTGSWSANQTNSTPINNTIWSTLVQGIPEGTWTWAVFCNDTYGNEDWSDTNRTFTVDQTPPTITLPYYDNSTTKTSSESITFNISVTDSLTTPQACLVYVDGQSSNTTLPYENGWCNGTVPLANSNEGQSTINVYANDSANNWALNDSYIVTIDDTAPTAYFGTNPIDNYNSSSRDITFELYCTDETSVQTLELWSNFTGSWSANQTNSTPINNTIWSVLVQGIPEGTYVWAARCLDGANNKDWTDTNRTITIDLTFPQITSVTNQSTTNESTLITWSTDEPANSSLIYGTTTDMTDGSNSSSSYTTSHSLQITSLDPATLYYYNVTSCDFAGNCNTTGPYTFQTTDSVSPTAYFGTNPINNFNTSSSSINFESLCTDNVAPSTIQIWSDYPGSWQSVATNSSPINNTVWSVTLNSIPQGHHKWAVFCNDTSSNEDWTDTNRTFTVDQTAPTITLPYYDNSTIRNSSQTLTLNISVTDTLNAIDSCLVSVQGQTSNQTLPYESGWCNGTISLTGSNEGQSTIFVYANDTAGDLALNDSYIVTIDETYPTAYFGNNPVDNYNSSSRDITFELYCTDETSVQTLELWSNFTGSWSANQTNSTPINNTIWSVLVQGIPEGTYVWAARCLDGANNADWTDTNRTITIDLTPPQITSVTNTSTTDTSTLITWNTQELANSSLIYGTDNTTLSDGSNSSATLTSSHSLQLNNLNPDTLYYYNVTSCDQVNNCNTTGPFNFTTQKNAGIDNEAPLIYLESPINNSGNTDGNVTFYYNVTDATGIENCSITLNGEVNGTSFVVSTGETQNFSISGLSAERYYWNITCYDNSPNHNMNTSSTRNIDIVLATIIGENLSVKDLSGVDTSSIENYYIEVENTSGINYTENLNLSGGVNLNVIINLSDNFVEVNSTLEPRLNKSANITFYNLDNQFNPLILRNGLICPDSICSLISYSPSTGNLVFSVKEFTNYSSTKNSQMEIWDSADEKGGLNIHYPNQLVSFFANYTNKTSFDTINGANVNCTINFSDSSNEMEYNASSGLYWYNRTFGHSGSISWNVTCNGTDLGYEELSLEDSVKIYSTWWNDSWNYRIPLTIENHSYDLEEFQVLIEIDNSNAPENWNWSDYNSLRFVWVNNSLNQEIPHYTEIWNETSNYTKIWVRVPLITNTSNETVYLYYGNGDAPDTSNPIDTMEIYEDFEDGMDYFTQRDTDGGSCSVSGGRLICSPTIQWSGAYAYSNLNFSSKYGYNIEFKMWKNQSTSGNPPQGHPVTYLRKPYPDLGYDTGYYYKVMSSSLIIDNRVDTYSGGDEQTTLAMWNNGTATTRNITDWTQYDNQYYDYIVNWDTDNNILSQNVTHNGSLHQSSQYIPESVITDIGPDFKLELGTWGYYDTNAEFESVVMRKYVPGNLNVDYGEEETRSFILTIYSPTDSSYDTKNILYSGKTSNNATIKMSINGNSNHTFCTDCTSFSLTTSDNVTEGYNNVNFWAISSANTSRIVNKSVTYFIDTITPDLSWNDEATKSGTYSFVSVTLNCSINETNVDTVGYFFNGTNSTTWDGNDGTNYWVTIRNLEFGTYNDNYCWVNDTLGHYNQTSKRNYELLWTDWWNADWSLRKPITIEERADKYDLRNVTLQVSINTSKLYDEGKIRSDCGDIRFVYNDTHKEIPYNFTNCETSGGNTTFWLMFDLDRADTILIYAYYNNSAALTTKESLKQYNRDDCTLYDSLDSETVGTINGVENTDYEWVSDGRGSTMLRELTDIFSDDWGVTPGSEGTIEFWLKLDQEMNTSDTTLSKNIIKGGRCGVAFDALSGATTNPGKLGFGISPQAGFYSEIFTNQDKWYKDNFYHIAVTWDGVNQSIYVNGTLDNSQAQTREGGWDNLTTTLNSNWGSGTYKISDVRLCPDARTSFPYVVYPEPNATVGGEESVPFLEVASPANTTYYSKLVNIFGETSEYANISWSMNGNSREVACLNCTSFNNYTVSGVVEGQNNITIYANSTETPLTDSQIIWFTVKVLEINNMNPLNHSGDIDGNITFQYNLTGTRGVENCSLILNGEFNQSNSTNITKNTMLNFTVNDLAVGAYNWSVDCATDDGATVQGNTSHVEVIYADLFDILSPDLSSTDIRDVAYLTIGNSSSGQVMFTQNIDLTGGMDINNLVNIGFNNTTVYSESESRLNISARISLYNLTFSETPAIINNDSVCLDCSVISYNSSNGTLVFDVPHFTTYTASENSVLEIWDETDEKGGGKTIYSGTPINVYANYTNKTDSSAINGTGVYCNLTDENGEYTMVYNETSHLYERQHTFYGNGNITYNITCNGSSKGFEPLKASDNASIVGAFLNVELVTPPSIPGDGEANMSSGYIVGANRTFALNATVICTQGYCGDVNATVRFNKSSEHPDTAVNNTYPTTDAFFIQEGPETVNCPTNPLEENEWCNVTFIVNTTAPLNSIWKIDVSFSSETGRTNDTADILIQVGKILLFDLSYDVIDFGILNPDGVEYLYPAINSSNMTYNVTVDPNSNNIDELWIKGTDLTNGTKEYNRYINVTNVKWSRSYLGDHPNIDEAGLFSLKKTFEKVNKDGIPIISGNNETTYFWLDSPGGILPLRYTGTLTIMGNSSF